MTPCIVTCAITGSLPQKADNQAVPITPAEQIESAHEAFEAGATLVHLHVRNDDGSTTSSPDRFAQVLAGLRRHCPGLIVQFSTGGRSGAGRERGAHLALEPDMASLATGSVNFPTRVYDNSPQLIDWLAGEMRAYGIKPEVEAFDLSMIFQAAAMEADGRIVGPLHVQFVMGIRNAMPVDRRVFDFYVETLRRLSPQATFTGAGIGRDDLGLESIGKPWSRTTEPAPCRFARWRASTGVRTRRLRTSLTVTGGFGREVGEPKVRHRRPSGSLRCRPKGCMSVFRPRAATSTERWPAAYCRKAGSCLPDSNGSKEPGCGPPRADTEGPLTPLS